LVVEYALRDMSKPMGVTRNRSTPALPEGLKSELPTNKHLATELPLLDLVSLRVQIERTVAEMAKAHDLKRERERWCFQMFSTVSYTGRELVAKRSSGRKGKSAIGDKYLLLLYQF
jgi:hypothetical protein